VADTRSAETRDAELKIPALHQGSRLLRALVAAGVLGGAAAAYFAYTREDAPVEQFRTVPVARRDLVQLVSATGRIDVTSRTEVPAPAPGRLLSVAVSAGDSVTAGQVLAELDARAAQLALRSAAASVEAAGGGVAKARVAVDAAEASLTRTKQLLARGLTSPEDVRQAESAVASAKASFDAAQAERRLASENAATAKLGQTLTRIDAPRAGVVLRAPERVGAAVSPDQPALFVIGDPLTTMRVDAQVSETDVGHVKVGQTASVLVSAYPGKSYPGKVERIGVDAERKDGAVLYPLRISVQNHDGTLLPGMSARVELEVARAAGALSVHEAALRFTPEGADEAAPRSRVFVRKGPSELSAVPVRTLVSDGVYAQVEPEGGELPEGAQVAVGLTGGKSSSPNVSLGGKK
jgi:HlyD family secretion protein